MRFREKKFDIHSILNRDRGTAPRSEGLHLSEVIAFMRAARLGETYTPRSEQERLDSGAGSYFSAGFAFERLLSKVWGEYMGEDTDGLVAQSEVTRDGIHMTPDAVDTRSEPHILHEYKSTWRSMTKLGVPAGAGLTEHFWEWLVQIKAYCRTVPTTRAELWVLFVNGDYKRGTDSGRPTIRRIELEFLPRELEENWRIVLKNAEALKRIKRG